MKFKERTLDNINEALTEKKRLNPISSNQIGIGVNVKDSLEGAGAYLNNWQICKLDDLNRVIEELTMLKESIEEVTGVIL